jgi:hypothetical protein
MQKIKDEQRYRNGDEEVLGADAIAGHALRVQQLPLLAELQLGSDNSIANRTWNHKEELLEEFLVALQDPFNSAHFHSQIFTSK